MLLDRLNELAREINEHCPTVNVGGCCVVAAAVARRLPRECNARVRFSGFDTDHEPIGELFESCKPRSMSEFSNHTDITCVHAVVEFEYDSTTYHYETHSGVRREDRHEPCCHGEIRPGALTAEQATVLARSPNGWNDMFPRRSIRTVHNLVRAYLRS